MLSTVFPLLTGQADPGVKEKLQKKHLYKYLPDWLRGETNLQERCRLCQGAAIFDDTGLPSVDICKRPKLMGNGEVIWQKCDVQITFRNRVIRDRILGSSGLPNRFKSRTLESFKTETAETKEALKTAWKLINEWGKPGQRGLLVLGPNGTGKTHLAAGILMRLASRGVPGKFLTAPAMMEQLRTAISQNEGVGQVLKLLGNVDLLVIDDLGKEYVKVEGEGSSWTTEQIWECVNRRYEADKPMIVTTNLTDDQIERRYGQAVFSRLCEMMDVIILDGPDWRMKS